MIIRNVVHVQMQTSVLHPHLSHAVDLVTDKVIFLHVVPGAQGPGVARLRLEALGEGELVGGEELGGAAAEAGGELAVAGAGGLGVREAEHAAQLGAGLALGAVQQLREHRVDGEWAEHEVRGTGQL